jgi:MFS family permease
MFARRREALALTARMDANGEAKPPHPPATERVRLLRTPEVVKALLAQLMYAVPFAALTVFGAEVARVTDQATAAQAQLAFTVFFVFSLSCRGLVAWRSPIFHKGIIYVISGLLTIMGLTFIVAGHSFTLFLVGMVILGIPHGVIFPLVLSALSSSLPADQLPRANSLLMGSSNIVGIVAPFILGVIAAATSYRFMMGTVLIPVILVFVVFVAIVGMMRMQLRSVTQSTP